MICHHHIRVWLRNFWLLSALLLSTSLHAQPPTQDQKAADSKPDESKTSAQILIVRRVDHSTLATLRVADMDKWTQQSVKVRDQSGQSITYSGVSLGNVLKGAGINLNENLHGRLLTMYLLVEAADEYRAVFALPEFDPNFTDRLILVATRRDGKLLLPEEGPFRMIVPDDKRQARWVRQARVLALMQAAPFNEKGRDKKP